MKRAELVLAWWFAFGPDAFVSQQLPLRAAVCQAPELDNPLLDGWQAMTCADWRSYYQDRQ